MESLIEIHENGHVRAAPFVYILVRVSYNKQILMPLRQHRYESQFSFGRVLKFIYLYIVKSFLPFFENFGVRLKQLKRKTNQIIKIKTEYVFFTLHIHSDYVVIARIPCFYTEIARDKHRDIIFTAFQFMYLVEHFFKARSVKLELKLGIYFFEYFLLVAFIENFEVSRIKQPSRILSQNSYTESVICRYQ